MPTSLRKPSNKAQEEVLEELKKDNYKKRVRRKFGVAETLASVSITIPPDAIVDSGNKTWGITSASGHVSIIPSVTSISVLPVLFPNATIVGDEINGFIVSGDATTNWTAAANLAGVTVTGSPSGNVVEIEYDFQNAGIFANVVNTAATAKTITVPQFTDSEGITRGAFYMELEQLAEGNPDAVILVVFDAGQPDEQVQRITAEMINDGWGSENINDAEDDFDTVEFRFPADSGVWEVEAGYIVKGDDSDRPLLNAVMDGTPAARLPVA